MSLINWDNRQWLAMPEEMEILKLFAEQPANFRSRKPARLIWLYTQGASKGEVIADLRLGEKTMEKYFRRWIDYGVAGLTGHAHPELGRIY